MAPAPQNCNFAAAGAQESPSKKKRRPSLRVFLMLCGTWNTWVRFDMFMSIKLILMYRRYEQIYTYASVFMCMYIWCIDACVFVLQRL